MKKQREIILLLVSMFIVTVSWIVLDLYHNAVTSTISQPLQQDITPISPDFNTTVIENLQKRQYTAPLYDIGIQPTQAASQSATVILTPTPSTQGITPASASSQITGILSPTP